MSKAIQVLSAVAFCIGVWMVGMDLHESWSQHEGTPEEKFLTSTILAIIWAYIIRTFTFEHRSRVLWKGFRVWHANLLTAALFSGVLIFSVNSPHPIDQTLHLVFTALAIASANIEPILYFRSGPAFWGSVAGATWAVGFFAANYFARWVTIGTAEVGAAWPVVVYVFANSKTK